MEYDILGPWTYNEFCNRGLNNKLTNAPETLSVLNNIIDFVHNGMDGKEKFFLDKRSEGEDNWKNPEFLGLKKEYDLKKGCLRDLILTSTETEGIPGKGIRIENKILPFVNKNIFFREENIRKVGRNKFVKSIFGKQAISNFLKENELDFTCKSEGYDNGAWKSQVTLDVDYDDSFFFYSFDDPFVIGGKDRKYFGFILK